MLLRTNRSGGNRTPYKKIYKPLHFKTLPSTSSRVFVGAFSTQQHSRAVQCLLAAATEGSTKSMQQCFQMRRYDRANGFTAKHCNGMMMLHFSRKKLTPTHAHKQVVVCFNVQQENKSNALLGGCMR